MSDHFATLEVQRYQPRRDVTHQGFPVVEKLYLRLRRPYSEGRRTLATLPPVPLVKRSESEPPEPLPYDRARVWEELVKWVQYCVIMEDPAVQEGQYENRLKWQSWAHLDRRRPRPEDLYDWRRDHDTLARLRTYYRPVVEKLSDLVGRPSRRDAAARHPNPFEDEGLSDDARRLMRDFRAVFGPDAVRG